MPQRGGFAGLGRLGEREEFLLLGMSWTSASYPAPFEGAPGDAHGVTSHMAPRGQRALSRMNFVFLFCFLVGKRAKEMDVLATSQGLGYRHRSVS